MVAVTPADTDNLTKTLSKAHVSEFPAALEIHADAPVSTPMPITIWLLLQRAVNKITVPARHWCDKSLLVDQLRQRLRLLPAYELGKATGLQGFITA